MLMALLGSQGKIYSRHLFSLRWIQDYCDDHNDDDDDDGCHNYYDCKAESDDVDDYDDAKGF